MVSNFLLAGIISLNYFNKNIYVYVKISLVDSFFVLQKKALSNIWSGQELLKKTNDKNWIFHVKKREKSDREWLVKVVKHVKPHPEISKQKNLIKKRKLNLEM